MPYGPIPDLTTWVGATGHEWTAKGTGLLVWKSPVITPLGAFPVQNMVEGGIYAEAGATAVDAAGTDISADIVIDSTAVDSNVPGDYPVTYNVADSFGYSADEVVRTVRVLDVDRPDVRDRLTSLLSVGLPSGIQVYDFPTEQQKVPAVVIGTMDWEPAVMDILKRVDWTVTVRLLVQRSKPAYNVYTLETLSLKVAQVLSEAGMRVTGFTSDGTEDVGGNPLLAGTLEVMYRETVEE